MMEGEKREEWIGGERKEGVRKRGGEGEGGVGVNPVHLCEAAIGFLF